jgi:hypothetical protein
MTIYCDETGNTGERLLDINQPLFVLASNDYSNEEARDLLVSLTSQDAPEVKFKVLKRTLAGQERLNSFLFDPRVNPTRIAVSMMNKRFMVFTKLVDIIMETVVHENGGDLYKDGANLATANMMYYCLPALCGEQLVEAVLESFVNLIRRRDNNQVSLYIAAGQNLLAVCQHTEMKDFMKGFFDKEIVKIWLPYLTQSEMDPAVPSLFRLIDTWGRRKAERFAVVHDRSKPVIQSESFFMNAMAALNESSSLVGYDRRKFLFPLRASNLRHENSHETPQLQIADICAGLTAHFVKCKSSGIDDDLSKTFESANGHEWIVDAVMPTPAVTPEELGTDDSSGSNPVEPFLTR